MLLQIDDLSRPDHTFLSREDLCYYIREYTSNEGFQASDNNQLVFNLKCPVGHTSTGRLYHKGRAIRTAAADVRQAFTGLDTAETVFIPIPPSKLAGDPNYDARVRQMLSDAEAHVGIKVVDALAIRANRLAAHESTERPSIDELEANFIVSSLDWVNAKVVAIFDDVLTTGRQFKAAVNVLRPYHPNASFVGVFWVRRIFPE